MTKRTYTVLLITAIVMLVAALSLFILGETYGRYSEEKTVGTVTVGTEGHIFGDWVWDTPENQQTDCETAYTRTRTCQIEGCGVTDTESALKQHRGIEVVGAVEATADTAGYSGDVYCTNHEPRVLIEKGEMIPALGADGIEIARPWESCIYDENAPEYFQWAYDLRTGINSETWDNEHWDNSGLSEGNRIFRYANDANLGRYVTADINGRGRAPEDNRNAGFTLNYFTKLKETGGYYVTVAFKNNLVNANLILQKEDHLVYGRTEMQQTILPKTTNGEWHYCTIPISVLQLDQNGKIAIAVWINVAQGKAPSGTAAIKVLGISHYMEDSLLAYTEESVQKGALPEASGNSVKTDGAFMDGFAVWQYVTSTPTGKAEASLDKSVRHTAEGQSIRVDLKGATFSDTDDNFDYIVYNVDLYLRLPKDGKYALSFWYLSDGNVNADVSVQDNVNFRLDNNPSVEIANPNGVNPVNGTNEMYVLNKEYNNQRVWKKATIEFYAEDPVTLNGGGFCSLRIQFSTTENSAVPNMYGTMWLDEFMVTELGSVELPGSDGRIGRTN